MLIKDHKERGVTLLEALVSIFILATAIFALMNVQMKTLVNASDAVQRGQAVRLIEDLSERVKSNVLGVAAYPNFVADFSATAPTFTPCVSACGSAELANSDRDEFLTRVNQMLPGGQAAIFVSTTDANQLGVMVGWRPNDRKEDTDSAGFNTPFEINAALLPSGIACPTGLRCHLMYIQGQ